MMKSTNYKEVIDHYQRTSAEHARLNQGIGILEFLRVQEIIRRHLPGDRLRILDVGGGAGIHATWLAEDGHRVHLIDPVPLHIEQAKTVAARLPAPFSASLDDARALSESSESQDIVLLLGPLYHLTERQDRLQALAEARRVLKPGGLMFAIAISRFASLFDGLANEYLFDPAFREIVTRDLRDGQHRNPSQVPGWFTTAYFHRPDELKAEARQAGFTVRELVGVQGMAGWQSRLAGRLEDPTELEIILESARAIEREPALIGLSAHIMLVGERDEGRDDTS